MLNISGDLNDFLTDQEVEDLKIDIADENYRILDEEQANFMLRRVAEVEAEVKEINETCDKSIEDHKRRVEMFREDKLKNCTSLINFYKNLLQEYAMSELEGSKKKSCKLAYGTLQFRKAPVKMNYDNDKLLALLKDRNVEVINTSVIEKIDKTKLKKELDFVDGKAFLNGELIDLIEVEENEDIFTFTSSIAKEQ